MLNQKDEERNGEVNWSACSADRLKKIGTFVKPEIDAAVYQVQ